MKKINKNSIIIFFTLITLLTIIWVGLIMNNLIKEKEFLIEKTISENAIKDKNTGVLIEKYMSEIIENIKVIRDADEIKSYLEDPSNETYDETVQLFIRIMNNKDAYDQLRYIDINGDEIIRIDNNGSATTTSVEKLQNKEDLYYFKESIQLAYDDIYISPLELNREDGVIEEPYNPMIRFATTVYDQENKLRGVLVVNYKADYFIELISEHNEHKEVTPVDFYILNSLGQYILNPDAQMNYSYMFEKTSILSYKEINENIWNEMSANKFMGSYVHGNKLCTYYDTLIDVKKANPSYAQSWITLHVIDISELISLETILKRLFFTSNNIALLLIVIFSFLVAFFAGKLKNKDRQLEITKKIADSTNDAIVITNRKTEIEYVNKAYEEASGYKYEEVIGSKPGRFKSGSHSKEFYINMWSDITENGQWEGTLWDQKKDGLLYPKKIKILAVKSKKNAVAHHYIGIFSDLSANKRKSDTYKTIDYKNGQLVIPNEEMMIDLLSQSIKTDNFDFMVVYFAIENYNQLVNTIENEKFNISVIFTELVKPLLQQDDFIAQTGRNLFAIIIGTNTIKGSTENFVSKLHREIGKVIDVNGRDIFFKTRAGVSYWPEDTTDLKRLLLNSMIALEWTSHRQEAEIAYFDEKMVEELNQENEIEAYLRKSIDKNELSIVYQPQIDILTEKVIGMEALLRWNNDVLGMVSPAIFIPIAEKTHLMIDIGNWIIKNVCEELKNLEEASMINNRELRCAINLSVIQMEEVGFVDKLFKIIDDNNIRSSQLEMEITESLLLTNEKRNVESLNKIRARGITIAIDDFGTGYSSLSYLNSMPIDKIKIDRTFIKNFPENDDGKLARILVDMSKSMGLKVLMEGAETKDQIEYLRNIGCDYIQGYYYSKPLSVDNFIDFVKKH